MFFLPEAILFSVPIIGLYYSLRETSFLLDWFKNLFSCCAAFFGRSHFILSTGIGFAAVLTVRPSLRCIRWQRLEYGFGVLCWTAGILPLRLVG